MSVSVSDIIAIFRKLNTFILNCIYTFQNKNIPFISKVLYLCQKTMATRYTTVRQLSVN